LRKISLTRFITLKKSFKHFNEYWKSVSFRWTNPPHMALPWTLRGPNAVLKLLAQFCPPNTIFLDLPLQRAAKFWPYNTRCSGPLSREGSLLCHTCCDMGPRFFWSHPKDRPIQLPFMTYKELWRIYFNPDPHGLSVQVLYM
jgi:hypothetical protein